MKWLNRFTVIALLLVFLPVSATAAPDLHHGWDTILKKHVSNGLVHYRNIGKKQHLLDKYLDKLAKVDISSFSRQEKLALWINAYNAFTVKLILKNYPVKSIRKISRPWKQKVWKAAGQVVSLDHIEHEILRKQIKEPRIHFAIVCASIGCPDLVPFAFRAEKVNQQLDEVARGFFGSSKHFRVEKNGDRAVIYISKIFSWFGEDFGKNKEEKVAFILPYLEKTTAEKLKTAGSVKFKYLGYDWNLNEMDN